MRSLTVVRLRGEAVSGYSNVPPIIGDRRGARRGTPNAPTTVTRWSCMVPRKFVVARVQWRLSPQRLWPGAAMIENISWFTIGALLGLIVFFYDGSTILS